MEEGDGVLLVRGFPVLSMDGVMNMKALFPALLVLFVLGVSTGHAEIVVVAGADNETRALSREDVINIFMGRYRRFPNGQEAVPLEREGDAPERQRFYQSLLNKRLEEIHAYWARLRFSGRTAPPRVIPGGRDAYLRAITETPGAIGYVEGGDLPRDLRVLLSLPE